MAVDLQELYDLTRRGHVARCVPGPRYRTELRVDVPDVGHGGPGSLYYAMDANGAWRYFGKQGGASYEALPAPVLCQLQPLVEWLEENSR